MRLLEILGQYKFRIVYIFRKDNSRANAPSRRTDYIEEKDIIDYPILK